LGGVTMGMVVASVVVVFVLWVAMIVMAFVLALVLVLVIAVSLLHTGADQAGGNELHPARRATVRRVAGHLWVHRAHESGFRRR